MYEYGECQCVLIHLEVFLSLLLRKIKTEAKVDSGVENLCVSVTQLQQLSTRSQTYFISNPRNLILSVLFLTINTSTEVEFISQFTQTKIDGRFIFSFKCAVFLVNSNLIILVFQNNITSDKIQADLTSINLNSFSTSNYILVSWVVL